MTIKTVKSSGGDYTTIQAAIDACPANITAGGTNETWEIEVYASIGAQDAISITGKTTDATHYIRIYAPVGQRHLGKPDTSSVRINQQFYYNAVECATTHAIFEGLQIAGGASNPNGGFNLTSTGTVGIEIRECLFDWTHGEQLGAIMVDGATGGTVKIRNCIFNGSQAIFVRNVNGSGYTTYVYNCTARSTIASSFAFLYGQNNVSAMVCKNCIGIMTAGGTNTAFLDTITGNNNISSDATAPGTSAQTNVTPSFVDAANGDLHLLGSDTIAKGHGADLHADGSYAFNIDIDSGSRPNGFWDAGADQLTASPGAVILSHLD